MNRSGQKSRGLVNSVGSRYMAQCQIDTCVCGEAASTPLRYILEWKKDEELYTHYLGRGVH